MRIRKQQPGSRSSKMPGSGFGEHGSETLLTQALSVIGLAIG
jgi:hypothetical protein